MYIAYGSTSVRGWTKFDTNDNIVNSFDGINDIAHFRVGNYTSNGGTAQQPEIVVQRDDSVFMFHHQNEVQSWIS